MLTLKKIELNGFKSFANKTVFDFSHPISAIVGPNGSGKSNIIEAIKWVTGDQALKGLRVKKGEELIFHGPNGNSFQNAAVSIILRNSKYSEPSSDNKNNAEEMKISRLIQKNGVNKYFLDKSETRLKNIIETLSLMRLSSSRHYIVNQGASDKILNASSVEKRLIIEGALGLDVCHIKILEFSKKIKQTEENIIKIHGLKNEINPHLKFLQKQINKFKKSASLKEILKNKCAVYFLKTASFIQNGEKELNVQKAEPQQKFKNITQNLKICEENLKINHVNPEKESVFWRIKQTEKKLGLCREKSLDYERQLGRIEGMLEAEKLNYKSPHIFMCGDKTNLAEPKTDIEEKIADGEIILKKQTLKSFYDDISLKIKEILNSKDNPASLTNKIWADIENIKKIIDEFFAFFSKPDKQYPEKKLFLTEQNQDRSEKLKKEKLFLEEKIKIIKTEETQLIKEAEKMKNKIETENKELNKFQEEKILLYNQLDAVKETLQKIEFEEMKLHSKMEEFEKEKADIMQFLEITENDILNIYKNTPNQRLLEEENIIKVREEMQKIRFRIEETSEPDKETMQEYETLTKRDELFEKELKDLRESLSSLTKIYADLKERLKSEFRKGLEKINDEFQKLFYKIFEGGKANLKIITVKTDEEQEEKIDLSPQSPGCDSKKEELKGVEIMINLPKKRVNSLEALSGGERSLISVALLFAITSVNPPPFLMLDETDAALDETNSKKYGLLLQEISKKTQLIIITHNRETMKQAGALLGITLGKDGISRLLSVKLDEIEN